MEQCFKSTISSDATPSPCCADRPNGQRNLEVLRARYEELMARSGKLASRVQRRRGILSECSIQNEYDKISDQMIALSAELSSVPARTLDALKLKASLLLDLLPDEADPMVFLAVSLCDDLINIESEHANPRVRALA